VSPVSEEARAELPGAVLFACNLNCVRSPMAAGLLRSQYAGRIFVDSCGLRAGMEVDPFAVAVLDEQGVDLTHHRPRAFQDLDDSSFDLVVSLTPEAHHRALEFARGLAMTVVYWPTLDPTLFEGGREQRMAQYRMVRDGLQRRIDDYFGRPSTFGG
jgi:protein-tyrosine-phosphatase